MEQNETKLNGKTEWIKITFYSCSLQTLAQVRQIDHCLKAMLALYENLVCVHLIHKIRSQMSTKSWIWHFDKTLKYGIYAQIADEHMEILYDFFIFTEFISRSKLFQFSLVSNFKTFQIWMNFFFHLFVCFVIMEKF